MHAVQQPLHSNALGDVMGTPAWKSLPSWFLVADGDQAIPPDAERQFAQRMGATTVEVATSHVAMVSHPDDVVELIETAAAAVPADGDVGLRAPGKIQAMASYSVNERGVERARQLIDARQYVLDSEWGAVQPRAADENAFLESHSWDEYSSWHLGLTDGANDETKARYAFVYGDFRRIHRMGLIACHYRAAEWRHKEIELAAHDLLQLLDAKSG